MSLIIAEAFEDAAALTNERFNALGAAGSIVAGGRLGNRYQVGTGGLMSLNIKPADQHATLILGMAVQSDRWSGGKLVAFHGDTGATEHLSFSTSGVPAIGTINVARGATSLGVCDIPDLAANTWGYFEFKATLHDTTGYIEIRFNGTTYFTFTGDTKNGGTGTVFDQFRSIASIGAGNTMKVDDLYLLNGAGSSPLNDFLGDITVESVIPNGDGSLSQLLGSDGNSVNNYQQVDDASMADYNGSSTSGQKDLYALGNLVHTTGTVLGVTVGVIAQNTDAGAQNIKIPIKSGSTTDSGSSFPVTTTPSYPYRSFGVNPDTSAAWTISEVNALEAGAEVG